VKSTAVADNRDPNESTSAYELLVRCAWCKRIKTGDVWADAADVQAMRLTREPVERHSHGICPDCFAKLTPSERP
jgi:hypothetical protein